MFFAGGRRFHFCCGLVLLACGPLAQTRAQAPATEPPVLVSPESEPAASSFWRQSYRGVLTPNMFGDYSGNRPLLGTMFRTGTPGAPGTPGSSRQISGSIQFNNDGSIQNSIFRANLDPQPSSPILTRQSFTPQFFLGQTISPVTTFTATANIPNTDPFPATVSLLENPTITQDIMTLFAQPGESAVFNPASAGNQQLRNLYNIFLVYDLVTPGTPGTPGISAINLTLALPNPVDGALIGRTKVSTDNNPLPRDRVIFNYDYLDNTPLRAGGQDINRFCFGFEKTFFDGLASVEVRLPFASTVNTTADDGIIDGSSTELGNLHVTLKALAYSGDLLSVSGGLGISTPTASDTRFGLGRVDLVRIDNETVLLTPFAAVLFTPTDRAYAQVWTQIGFDTEGNPVRVNLGNQGLRTIGRLNDPSLFQMDCQFGYWLIQPGTSSGVLRALAPFLELHYNSTLGRPDRVSAGNLTIVNSLNSYDEFNVSAGTTAKVGDNSYLTAGVTAPLSTGNNRFGGIQVGLRLSWFFGPTGDARTRAMPNF